MPSDEDIIEGEIIESTEIEPVHADLESVGAAPIQRSEALLSVRQGIAQLDRQREELVKADDRQALAWAAHDVDQVKRDLADLLRALQSDLARLMLSDHTGRGNPKLMVPGLGEVDVPGGNERKNWESKKLLREIVMTSLVNEDGALLAEDAVGAASLIIDALTETLPLNASTAWKVGQKVAGSDDYKGGLRGRGIDPSDYCEETAKPRLAKIPTPDREA